MKITNIKESGTNNILRWAILNNADIKNDMPLQSIINSETFYHITVENVNFLELFRLTQSYRDKVRILDEKQAAIPTRKELMEVFPGDEEGDDGEKIPLVELAELAAQQFVNLTLQMQADDDIIRPETLRLFLPMICRQFTIQIPVSFMDIVNALPVDQAKLLFNTTYPNNLMDVIFESGDKTVLNMLHLMMIKAVSLISYDDHYDNLLKVTKFSLLKNATTERLYRFRMIGFYKYDNINRSEIRCSMFKPDKNTMNSNMKHMARLQTGLKIEFAVQLPIQYMQMIENYFDNEELKISYESSIGTIIDDGLNFNDFITQEFDNDEELIKEYNNSIESYNSRIAECNQGTIDTIGVLANSSNDVDLTSAFASLPAIYTTKAVFTIDMDYADAYVNHYDALIVDMFYQMLEIGNNIIEEMNAAK